MCHKIKFCNHRRLGSTAPPSLSNIMVLNASQCHIHYVETPGHTKQSTNGVAQCSPPCQQGKDELKTAQHNERPRVTVALFI